MRRDRPKRIWHRGGRRQWDVLGMLQMIAGGAAIIAIVGYVIYLFVFSTDGFTVYLPLVVR